MTSLNAKVERVVIVGKTRMGGGVCIGGIVEGTGRAVRLLPIGKFCHPPDTSFQIGEVWEMTLRERPRLEPPHLEDHDEWDARKVGETRDMVSFIKGSVNPYAGEPSGLFEGMLRFRATGSGFLPRGTRLPTSSVSFWLAPRVLSLVEFENKHRYRLEGSSRLSIPYVGVDAPAERIPAESLLRVSLARWWKNPNAADEGETCSLQLSGWFGLPTIVQTPTESDQDDDEFPIF